MKKIILRLLTIIIAVFLLVWIFGYENTIGWVLRRDYEVVPGTGIQFFPCIVIPLIVIAMLFRPVCYVVGGICFLWFLGWVIKFSWNCLLDYGINGSSPLAKIIIVALVVSVLITMWGAFLKMKEDA